MKSVRVFCLLALGFPLAAAEVTSGSFSLPYEVRWGNATLPAGDYVFRVLSPAPPYIVSIRGAEKNVLVAGKSVETNRHSAPSRLDIVESDRGKAVRALQLGETGMIVHFAVPGHAGQSLPGVSVSGGSSGGK